MPVVARADMNGYRDFEHGHLRTSSYANGYNPYRGTRDDFSDYPGSPRRGGGAPTDLLTSRSEYPPMSARSDFTASRLYRDGMNGRRHNGVDDYEHNSFDGGMRDGSEPSFEVDHLATYTSKSGVTHPEDGLTKLKQMESSTGIWTMRCLMIIERRNIIIVDKGNGDELERFPMTHIHEPTAVLKNDRRETYNNLVLFTVIEDPRRKNSPSDMHIFQSVNTRAHDVVDQILEAKGESMSRRPPERIPPPPREPAPEPPYGGYRASRVGRASYIQNHDMDAGQNEALEKDVQLLNHCFDDIEKFVSRLQFAAEAYKELERKRLDRGNKKKQRSQGDGMLRARAQPPPAKDFVDIFQKFKFAFNLLAKLKAHIHDPNAPELVHFLFTPLSLIYEASRDPIHKGLDLSGEAVAPLLLYDAKQLLLNCLTSKELELWQRLGQPWTLLKDEFNGHVPPYNPRFYDGTSPSPQVMDEINRPPGLRETRPSYGDDFRGTVVPAFDDAPYSRTEREDYTGYRRSQAEPRDLRSSERPLDDYRSPRDNPYSSEIRTTARPEAPPSPGPALNNPYPDYKDQYNRSSKHVDSAPPASREEANAQYAQELRRMGATIYEVVLERQGKNQKELSVQKGDIVQVVDQTRKWWKVKNFEGEMGYAPYTILREYQTRDEDTNGRRLSGDYSPFINGGNAPPPAPPPMAGSNRPGSRGDRPPPVEDRPKIKSTDRSSRYHPAGGNRYSDDLHNELRIKMSTSDERLSPMSRSPRSPQQPAVHNITQYSSSEDVRGWLDLKGFSRRCLNLLDGYAGTDLFSLEKQELERLLGRDEGRHLDSLLTVQKNNAGYRSTRGTSELKAILQRRKERADDNVGAEAGIGSRPSFAPDTPPDYSESEASSDDFGDAGKTLRNLLERQRKKIQSGYYQQYD